MTATPATPAPAAPISPAPKKHSLGKLIIRLLGALVLLILIGLITLYFLRNTLVARGVTYGGKYATGQETSLNAADLSLAGKLGLSQFQINNLTGYKEPQLLTMKDCNVDVDTGSLLAGTVVVNSISISGLEITVEQNGFKNNLSDLIENLKKNSPATGDASSAQESPGKSLQVKNIHLADTKVHLRGLISLDLDLGEINMDDVTNPNGRAVKIADVMAKVLLRVALQIMQQIANDPRIPAQFKDSLKNVDALVKGLQGDLLKGDLAKNLKNFNLGGLKDAGGQLQNLGKDAGKQIQGLQGLIPGGKPPASQPK